MNNSIKFTILCLFNFEAFNSAKLCAKRISINNLFPLFNKGYLVRMWGETTGIVNILIPQYTLFKSLYFYLNIV